MASWIAGASEAVAPVAGLCIYFDPDGDIHTIIRNLEPEHVDPLLSRMQELTGKLKAFRDGK